MDKEFLNQIKGRKVAILGLGIEGVALFQFLNQGGCHICICDQRSEKDLLASSPADLKNDLQKILSNHKIEKRLGPEYLKDLFDFYMVFRSPGIYFNDQHLVDLRNKGVLVSSQIKLFFDLCPAKIIGVTGTKGKGTTASLIYEMIKQDGKKKVFLAGNIGYPAITKIAEISKDDLVVLELSSFQLADLDKSPHISVVTNLGVDHLDYHYDILEYRTAKSNILLYQLDKDFAILNLESTFDHEVLNEIRSDICYFSKNDQRVKAYLKEGHGVNEAVLAKDGKVEIICRQNEIKLVGSHNLENICAAAITADILGISLSTIRRVAKEFSGLPYRLQYIATVNGVDFINDSIGTNPEPTIAAIKSIQKDKVLILGGSSKGADFSNLSKEITGTNVKAVVVIGSEGEKISKSLKTAGFLGKIISGGQEMKDIVKVAFQASTAGDAVILSPACASFDMFASYKDRGERFNQAVLELKDE